MRNYDLVQGPDGKIMAVPRAADSGGFPWINAVLFITTVFTVMIAGVYLAHFDYDMIRFWVMLKNRPERIFDGIYFAVPLLAILGAHEFGHYIMSRHHGVRSSLPYFIPAPNLVGTFGAVILMKSRIPDRRALFDIGAAGPLMGFAVAVFTMLVGLATAHTVYFSAVDAPGGMVVFNNNLVFRLAEMFFHHAGGVQISPFEVPRTPVLASPLLDAACVGFLVTALNLLPVGQLDGGHISYAVLGKRSFWMSLLALAGMAVLGYFYWLPWIFMGVLLVFLMGFKGIVHPPPDHPEVPLTPGRIILAVIVLLVFISVIAPEPLQVLAFP